MSSRKTTISTVIDLPLLESVEAKAREAGKSRSELIREMLSQKLQEENE